MIAVAVSLPSALVAAAAAVPAPPGLAAAHPMIVERVEAALERVVEAPEDAAAWADLGQLLQVHDWNRDAVTSYERAIALRGDEARWWHLLALAHAEAGDLAAALEANDAVRRLAPDFVPGAWRRGFWLLDIGRPEGAAASFRTALELAPGDPAATAGLARALLLTGDAASAVDLLESYLGAHPADGHARRIYAAALRTTGRLDEAGSHQALARGAEPIEQDSWEEELRRRGTGRGNVMGRATNLLAAGRPSEAIAELEELRRHEPDDALLLNKLGEAYLVARRPRQALELFSAALELEPDDPATHLHLAQAEGLAGRDDRALRHVERALELHPAHWPSHYERGKILHRAGRLDEAAGAYSRALDNGAGDHYQALALLAEARYRLQRWEAAEEVFARLAERFPGSATGFAGLAAVRAELGRLDAAREALAEARRLAPGAQGLRAIAVRIEQLAAALAAEGGS